MKPTQAHEVTPPTPFVSAAAVAGAKALAQLAEAANKAGDHAQAIKQYEAAIELTPNNDELYWRLGEQKFFLKQYDAAIIDYNRSLAINPKSWIACAYIARALAKQGRYDLALSYNEKGLALAPDEGWIRHDWQNLRDSRSIAALSGPGAEIKNDLFKIAGSTDYASIIEKSSKMIESAPSWSIGYTYRGIALYHSDRMSEALADFDVAIKLDPIFALAWRWRADVLAGQGHAGLSLAAYNRSVALDPTSESLNDRGVVYYKMGDYTSAQRDFKAAAADDAADDASLTTARKNLASAQKHLQAEIAAATPSKPQATVFSSGSYSSSCIRDFEKFNQVSRAGNHSQAFASNDTSLLTVNDGIAGLMDRCASYDPEAAEQARRGRAEAARIRAFCAGSHASYECTEYGSSPDLNRGYMEWFSNELSRVLSDPNYSADLGTAGGLVARPPTASEVAQQQHDHDAEQSCRTQTDSIVAQLNTANQALGEVSAVTTLERLMWGTKSTIDIIDRTCPASPSFMPMLASYKKTYAEAAESCGQVSSTGQCTPRLNPVPNSQQTSSTGAAGPSTNAAPSTAGQSIPPAKKSDNPHDVCTFGINYNATACDCQKSNGTSSVACKTVNWR